MKTIFIFLVFLLPTLLWGQITNHFNHLDSKWNVSKTYPAANLQNPNFVATTTTVFGYQGDTLIDNEQWFKLYSTNDSLFQNNLIYQGFTRAENNTILYLNTLNQIDTLYDFNLEIGDSVLFKLYGMYPEWIPVINIDSVQLSGVFYRRLKFAEPDMIAFDVLNEVWIEGIGSIHGPLFPEFPVKFSQEMPDSMFLTCTYSDNQQIWQHLSYTSCYINIVLNTKIKEILNFTIYPNPAIGSVYVNCIDKKGFKIQLFNMLGASVLQRELISDSNEIDLSALSKGIYIIQLSSIDGIFQQKLIKE